MGFRLQQKLTTLNDCSVIRVMRVLTKRLRLESRVFRYKVALYLSYLHNKFDDDVKGDPFEFQTYVPIRLCPKLNWRQILQLLRLVTKIYGNERTCDK